MNFKTLGTLGAMTLAMSFGAMAQATWYPSKWGPNDEIGAANYLTPALALQASKLVTTGKVYSLGITMSTTTPAYPPRTCSIYIVQPSQQGGSEAFHYTQLHLCSASR